MPTIQRFEDLLVWQKARALAKKIYALTFVPPLADDYRLKDQMRGSSGAVMDNIAEGFERSSRLEFINSLTTAKGEAGELKSQSYRALDAGYFSQALFEELYADTDEITRMLTNLIKYLNQSTYKGQKFKDRI